MGLKFFDWFAGIGGFRLGLEQAGHTCVGACEINKHARKIYAARFGHEPMFGDINLVRPEEIPEADLWCGGFPCQDLSTAGRRAGIGGARSGLVWKLLELVEALENGPKREEHQVMLAYMNRLSSLLYAFARLANHRAGIKEEKPHY